MKSVILTKVNKGKPQFKDLVGLKPINPDNFTEQLAKSLHKNIDIINEDNCIKVVTNKAFYKFINYSDKYILRTNLTTGTKSWYKIS